MSKIFLKTLLNSFFAGIVVLVAMCLLLLAMGEKLAPSTAVPVAFLLAGGSLLYGPLLMMRRYGRMYGLAVFARLPRAIHAVCLLVAAVTLGLLLYAVPYAIAVGFACAGMHVAVAGFTSRLALKLA